MASDLVLNESEDKEDSEEERESRRGASRDISLMFSESPGMCLEI